MTSMSKKYQFESPTCDCCGAKLFYPLAIDWGTAVIVKAVARAVRLKGINVIHPTKEMEVPGSEWNYLRAVNEGKLTSTQIGNLKGRAKAHGLVAQYKDEPGNYVLTSKGAKFLRGEPIPAVRIRRKKGVTTDYPSGEKYYKPDQYQVTIHEILKPGSDFPVWDGIDFDIVNGRIVNDFEEGTTKPIFA